MPSDKHQMIIDIILQTIIDITRVHGPFLSFDAVCMDCRGAFRTVLDL